MKDILNFLIEIGKLKKTLRRGWLLRGIKNPETIADHSFRAAMMAWILGQSKFNTERAIKIILVHDLAKVYCRDVTPFEEIISQKKNIGKKIFEEWPFGLKRKKEKTFYRNYKEEYKAFKELTRDLPPYLSKNLLSFWNDYQKGLTKEGRFVQQIDQVENLLQAMEYWERDKSFPIQPWWKSVRALVDQPILLKFLEELDRKNHNPLTASPRLRQDSRKTSFGNILNFLLEIGKLKTIPRTGWVLIGVKNPETIATHTFHEAIMVWILAEENKINFNIEKMLKMALIHDLCEVYAGDMTPYDEILPKNKKEWPELFDKWPRFSKSEKVKKFLKKHKKETIALEKLISELPSHLKIEIKNLWRDYELRSTKEGRFVKQVGRLTTLLQALEYGKESKKRPYKSWWLGTEEIIDDPFLLEFLKALGKKFYFGGGMKTAKNLPAGRQGTCPEGDTPSL